ncbi:hypothetical protein MKW92_010671 [Papaver armeniacum]|nr:hypothetical protein MKW92_010671 [Papaver armeniacum]
MALQILAKFQCFFLMYLAFAEILITGSQLISKPGCKDRCGNVSIPYPFGIGPGCFLDKYFEIRCNESLLNSIRPVYGPNYNISNISILGGDMTTEIFIASDCPGREVPNYYSTAGFAKFTFSNTKNKFIGMGCNTWAYQKPNGNQSISTGCLSVCDDIEDSTDGSCAGVGCCQAPVPSGLRKLNFSVGSMSNTGRSLSFNPCSYAFFIEEKSFNFSASYFKDFKNNGTGRVPVVVDWTVGFDTCDEARKNSTTYACGLNTDCIAPADNTTPGYRCNCSTGYTGNPYLSSSSYGGCRDIDECNEPGVCSGKGRCENTKGSYLCFCNKGYSLNVSNDIKDCIVDISQNHNLNKIVVGACLGLFLLLVILATGLWIYWGYKKRKHMQVREEFFKKNGAAGASAAAAPPELAAAPPPELATKEPSLAPPITI